jgi:uncharacterized membrane protein YfcA
MNIFLLLMIGVVGGLIGGIFGVGGGIIIIPLLVFLLGFSQHLAQGTMVFIFLLPTSIFGFWAYYKAGHIDIPAAILVAVGMVAGTWIGAIHAQTLPAPVLKRLFGILMLMGSLKLIFGK